MFYLDIKKYELRLAALSLISMVSFGAMGAAAMAPDTVASTDTISTASAVKVEGDSLALPAYDLQEVVVKSENVVRKGNLTELYPGKRDRRFASGSKDVLANMNLPELNINPLSGEVTYSDGQAVQMFN